MITTKLLVPLWGVPGSSGLLSESISHPLFGMFSTWVILLVTTVVVLVTSPRPLTEYWLPIDGKLLAGPKDSIQMVIGSNPRVGKGFYLKNLY